MGGSVAELTAALATTDELRGDDAETERLAAILAQIAEIGEAATPAAAAVIPLLAQGYPRAGHARVTLDKMIPEIVARDLVAALEDPARREVTLEAFSEIAVAESGSFTREPLPFVIALRDIAVPVLISLLATEDLRRSAIPHALGLIGAKDERAFDTLVSLIGDPDPFVRRWAGHGLKYFGDRAIPHLEVLLRDFGEADEAAVYILGRLATPAALTALRKAARFRGHIGRQARDTLGSIAARRARETADGTTPKKAAKKPGKQAKHPAKKKPTKPTTTTTTTKPKAEKPSKRKR